MKNIVDNLKKEIIEQLNFENLSPEDINEESPLFGPDGLGLDSIDALELILILEKNYGLKLSPEEDGKSVLYSVKSMAEFIIKNKK